MGDNNYYKDGIGKDGIGYFSADGKTIKTTTKFGTTADEVITQLNALGVTDGNKGDAIKLIDPKKIVGDIYLDGTTWKLGKKPE